MLRMHTGVGLLLAALVFAAGGPAPAHDGASKGAVPLPTHKIYRGEKCVEPTDEMRRNHMKKILHQRDDTVHEGIRTTKHSLRNCINCHADPKTNSVLGKDGFCQGCHTYAAVNMDCFSCHTDKAEKDAKVPPLRTSDNGPAFLNRIASTNELRQAR